MDSMPAEVVEEKKKKDDAPGSTVDVAVPDPTAVVAAAD